METLHGVIDKITYQNSDNGYTVAKLFVPGGRESVVIVGHMALLQPGESIICKGEWQTHLAYGKQFVVESYQSHRPADVEGVRRYLGSGLIKGIGPTYAKRIVDAFGVATLDILDHSPERLHEVEGLGKKRCELIVSSWQTQNKIRDVMIFLQGHGVSNAYAQKIWKAYGSSCLEKLQQDPYCLARDIRGIGLKIADQIAMKLGVAADSPSRLEAGLEYLLGELMGDGHVCYPEEEFLASATQHFECDEQMLRPHLDALVQKGRIVRAPLVQEGQQSDHLWLAACWQTEAGIVRELRRLLFGRSALRSVDAARAIAWSEKELALTLARRQNEAVAGVLSDKVMVLTGGPGTGKSTITKAILAICSHLTKNIVLMAPTGRAAKRMTEITGYKASTIHSLLEWNFQQGGFKRNRQNPLEGDLFIVDEASMIDTFLMYSLLKALPDSGRLLLVGDIDQLPSVGPGNVLKDLIASGALPVVTLDEIYRQAQDSHIVTNAHRINKGLMPQIDNQHSGDFFFVERQEPQALLQTVVALVSDRLPKKHRFDAFHDVQVLVPMKKGIIGADHLNSELQRALNPTPSHFLTFMGQRFAVGDKVMQLRNDYHKGVFNGDVGFIREVDAADNSMLIAFDEREVAYEYSDLHDVTLAYAVTVHKYQGSQCRAIIVVVHTSHYKLLHRNMLYTAVTRAQQLVVVVGTLKALNIATRNNEVQRRHTGLRQALLGCGAQIV